MCVRWTKVPVNKQTLIAHPLAMTHVYEKSNPFYQGKYDAERQCTSVSAACQGGKLSLWPPRENVPLVPHRNLLLTGPRSFLSTAADLHILAVHDLLRIDVVADNHSIKRVHHFFPCHCAVVDGLVRIWIEFVVHRVIE